VATSRTRLVSQSFSIHTMRSTVATCWRRRSATLFRSLLSVASISQWLGQRQLTSQGRLSTRLNQAILHWGQLIQLMANLWAATPNSGTKTQYSPLQAADFRAWELRKIAADYLAVKDEPPDVKLVPRKSYVALDQIPHDHVVYTERTLEELCRNWPVPRRPSA